MVIFTLVLLTLLVILAYIADDIIRSTKQKPFQPVRKDSPRRSQDKNNRS